MYTKFQLALQYYPELIDNPELASRRFRRDIHTDQPLMNALAKTGYRRMQQKLTPRQVEIIREYIGDPIG